RRVEGLVNPSLSGLPAFLTPDGGLNSGFMIPQYVAAALVSENKVLCHPASGDSIPTSPGQEDHVWRGNASAARGGLGSLPPPDRGVEGRAPRAQLRELSPRLHDARPLAGDIARVAAAV